MKTKNKSFKTAAICGALAVLSLVNVCVLSFNKSQVSPILTRNVNADAGPIGFVIGYLFGEYSQSNKVYYRYDTAETICNPVNIANGTMSLEQLLNTAFSASANLPMDGKYGVPVEGGGTATLDMHKTAKGSFDFSVEITLPGTNWKVKTCEPCGPDAEGVLSCKCEPYDQCAQVVKTRITAYKQALRIK